MCQEFQFPKEILTGKVTGAIEQKLDMNDFGITSIVAGSQIKQVGKDQHPIDMSQQENVDAFLADFQTWMERTKSDKEGKGYGFVDLTTQAIPYGTSIA